MTSYKDMRALALASQGMEDPRLRVRLVSRYLRWAALRRMGVRR